MISASLPGHLGPVRPAARYRSERLTSDGPLVLEAARATPPAEPEALRQTVRELLPELQRRGLVGLARADLPAAMDPALVARSEIRDLNPSFHFVTLPTSRSGYHNASYATGAPRGAEETDELKELVTCSGDRSGLVPRTRN